MAARNPRPGISRNELVRTNVSIWIKRDFCYVFSKTCGRPAPLTTRSTCSECWCNFRNAWLQAWLACFTSKFNFVVLSGNLFLWTTKLNLRGKTSEMSPTWSNVFLTYVTSYSKPREDSNLVPRVLSYQKALGTRLGKAGANGGPNLNIFKKL